MTIRTIALLALVASLASCGERSSSKVRATYDQKTGRLSTVSVDANKNGRVDTVSHMDGARIISIEVDLDENGKTDRWDFYGQDGRLEKVGLSRENDGVMDALAYYSADKVLTRMEISTGRNGRFDRVESYEAGVLARSSDDTNGDGRADKWDEYRPVDDASVGYTVVSTAVDESGSGKPERRFVFGSTGSIERVEVDPDGDGAFVRVDARR